MFMKAGTHAKPRLIEVFRDDPSLPRLSSSYSTSSFYDLSVVHEVHGWRMELKVKHLDQPVTKSYTGTLFERHIEEPRMFVAIVDGIQRGWIEMGYEKWNNRMRVWVFFVERESRRQGIGRLLMDQAVKVASERDARMLVLETQSCDAPAIDFYIKYGFALIGFDSAAYSNLLPPLKQKTKLCYRLTCGF